MKRYLASAPRRRRLKGMENERVGGTYALPHIIVDLEEMRAILIVSVHILILRLD